MTDSNDVPIKEFRAGMIHASIWGKTVKRNDRAWTEHSIRVLKEYKDDRAGEWRTTTFFRTEDLPKLALVASKAFEFLSLREVSRPLASAPPDAPDSRSTAEPARRHDVLGK